jgi:hypothetical protein
MTSPNLVKPEEVDRLVQIHLEDAVVEDRLEAAVLEADVVVDEEEAVEGAQVEGRLCDEVDTVLHSSSLTEID